MATERDYQGLYDRIAALRDQVTSRLASDLITNPQLADNAPCRSRNIQKSRRRR
jgi:hypothetical protein